MQASLAVLSGICGIAASVRDSHVAWMAGALLILANWPYTMLAMLSLNHDLMRRPEEAADATSTGMLHRWGRLHAVRTGLGLAAATAFLWASWRVE
jgi:hypothetical protein